MNQSDSHQSSGALHTLFHTLHKLPVSDRILVHVLLATIVGSLLWLALSINNNFTQTVPVPGGTVAEGVIGTPRFINPVLATTRADRDMAALVYDGLLTLDHEGNLVPNLATEISRDETGTTYTIDLRDDATFHDGTAVTAEDVIFTYELIQDPDLKSPLRGSWSNIQVTQINPHRLQIDLPEPYAPFIENLIVGILPKHVWEDVGVSELPFHHRNTDPIGSGPYKIDKIIRSSNGNIQSYTLSVHQNNQSGSQLAHVQVHFFRSLRDLTSALANNRITSTADIPTYMLHEYENDDFHIITTPLPRVFGVFFNQNRNTALRDTAVRQALSLAIDRSQIVTEATHGYGIPTSIPIPPAYSAVESPDVLHHPSHQSDLAQAEELLRDNGWERNENDIWERTIDDETTTLSITLRTANTPQFERTAELIAQSWEQLGAEVRHQQYEEPDLLNGIIRPRDFEAVLFGMDVGHTVDLYPFWHSSQQADPGLNIAQYANISTDRLLNTARNQTEEVSVTEVKQDIITTLAEEVPAIFLFSPTTNHVITADITSHHIPRLISTSDRLKAVTGWHRETDTLWPIFHDTRAITNSE